MFRKNTFNESARERSTLFDVRNDKRFGESPQYEHERSTFRHIRRNNGKRASYKLRMRILRNLGNYWSERFAFGKHILVSSCWVFWHKFYFDGMSRRAENGILWFRVNVIAIRTSIREMYLSEVLPQVLVDWGYFLEICDVLRFMRNSR